MVCQVLEGVQMDALLNQEQRHRLAKQSSRVVWKIKVVDEGSMEYDLDTKDHAYIAGVCIDEKGYILSMPLVTKPGQKYVGSCSSWRQGWTKLTVVKTSSIYGLSVLRLERVGHKKVDYTNLAESGVLTVKQHVYGVGHSVLLDLECADTFVRGSVEYPCEDIRDMPPCVSDVEDQEENEDDESAGTRFGYENAIAVSPRMVKHLTWISSVKRLAKSSHMTLFQMHPDIPLVQIKNFHIGDCGGPVFVSSGHVIGINIFKFKDINFAVHLSAIREFLKAAGLLKAMPELMQTRVEDQNVGPQEPQVAAAAKLT